VAALAELTCAVEVRVEAARPVDRGGRRKEWERGGESFIAELLTVSVVSRDVLGRTAQVGHDANSLSFFLKMKQQRTIAHICAGYTLQFRAY
jgi:hypothetical protein